jgi:hypothetical protein
MVPDMITYLKNFKMIKQVYGINHSILMNDCIKEMIDIQISKIKKVNN